MNELAILGIGALTPDGTGWSGLAPAAPAVPDFVPSLRRPEGAPFAARRVADAALQEWTRVPRLRRASRITLMMAEAAQQAMRGRKPTRLGIVGAFFTGPCHFSRRFFEPVIQRGPSFASPALFPETVYNSSLSHLAHLLGVEGSCYAMVGDDSAWVSAIDVASLWLDLDLVDAVLVVGGEELDVSAVEAYAAAGWLKNGFLPAEGAAAMLVGRPDGDPAATISALAPGIAYRSRASTHRAVQENFAAMSDAPLAPTAGATWMQPLVTAHAGTREFAPVAPPAVGHAFTATAGWHTFLGLRWLLEQPSAGSLWVPIWGLHHRVAGLRLQTTGGQRLARFEEAG